MAGRKTIIGSKALMLTAAGETEVAAQIFDYTLIREIRADLKELEVKILTTYDDSFYRIFKINIDDPKDQKKIEDGKKVLVKFYNDLLNASMRFSKEELEKLSENFKNQQQALENSRLKKENEEVKDILTPQVKAAKPKAKK